ncbi:hypothetical protein P8452_35468 [Trifolium repens]|nr:hypothetical protein P8452_30122 [Trifolium repens]WJX48974.1 hypothetical protein P8452_35468 [Trifolium repens]
MNFKNKDDFWRDEKTWEETCVAIVLIFYEPPFSFPFLARLFILISTLEIHEEFATCFRFFGCSFSQIQSLSREILFECGQYICSLDVDNII